MPTKRKRLSKSQLDKFHRETSHVFDTDKYFEVKFRTNDPSPPEMEEFYENLSNAINKKWFYQEYGVRGKDKGHRKIGFMNLTPLQYSTVKHTARRFLPKPTFKKT